MVNSGPRSFDDKVVRDKTGKSSEEWYSLLDRWGAKEKGHTRIAKYLREECGVSPWWSQAVTIRYEYERGLRM
ncbi:MAG: hypothetical protein ACE5KG_06105 [Nitrososphaerales archaeon]